MACSDGPASHRQKRSQRITVCLGDTDNGLTHRRELPRSASSGALWRCGVAIAGERLCGHDGKGRAMADLSLLDRLVQRIASLDLSNEQYLQVVTAIEHELSMTPPAQAPAPEPGAVPGLYADEPKPTTE
jgi:hypothetical protein